jgi:GT2 family glycosyltransferase
VPSLLPHDSCRGEARFSETGLNVDVLEKEVMQPVSGGFQQLIHTLNQRYRDEFARAQRLQAELDHIRGSRLWPLFRFLRRLRCGLARSEPSAPALDAHKAQLLDHCRVPPAGKVSIIIPFKDQIGLLRGCLHSLRPSTYRRFEVVLVDNGSSEPALLRWLARLKSRRGFRVVTDAAPFNFARLCNRGAQTARGDWLLFLNNDTEVLTPDWLERMLEVAGHPRVGTVGATLLYPDQTIQHAGIFPGADGRWRHVHEGEPAISAGERGELHHVRAVPAVTGACLLIGKGLFDELRGFDTRFGLDYNDVDLCRRVGERGLAVAVTPHARLMHYVSMSRGFGKPRDINTPPVAV